MGTWPASAVVVIIVSIVARSHHRQHIANIIIIVSFCHHCQHCCQLSSVPKWLDAIHWIVSRLDRTLFANGTHSLAIQQPHPLTSLCTTLVWWSSHLHRKYFNPLHFKFISIAWLEIWFDDRAMNTCLVFDFAKFAVINY